MVSSVQIRPVDKSTRKTFPTHPPYLAMSFILLPTSYDNRYKPQPFPVESLLWVRPEVVPYRSNHAKPCSSVPRQDRPPHTWVSHSRGNTWLPCLYLNRKISSPMDMPAGTSYSRYISWHPQPGHRWEVSPQSHHSGTHWHKAPDEDTVCRDHGR